MKNEFKVIADLIEKNKKVLDVGCADGTLMKFLKDNKNINIRGLEISKERVQECIAKGLTVIEGNAETDLKQFPDKSFDYVILSQTLQAFLDPENVISELLRVGKKGQEKVAAVDSDNLIRDLSQYVKDLDPNTLNEGTLNKLTQIDLSKLNKINSNVRIGSCISNPVDFLAIGLNYKAHAEGTNSKLPTEPILFNKSSGCIQGPNDPILKPIAANKMDYEVEVAMVIGKEGKNISENNAQEYVFGYCIVNDISERSWQKERGGQWIKGKSIAGPTGPYLVTKDEIVDINNLNLSLDVNGERRQTGNTERMIFNFNFLISHISHFMTLYPGTIITTGTPAGTAMEMDMPKFLQVGDKLNLKVDHLGEQNHIVVEES